LDFPASWPICGLNPGRVEASCFRDAEKNDTPTTQSALRPGPHFHIAAGVSFLVAMQMDSERIPSELKAIPHWVGWRYGPARPNGSRQKVPVDPTSGRNAKSDDSRSWGSFDAAVDAAVRHGWDGVGLMFAPGDGLVGVDFDDCIVDGQLTPDAAEAVRKLSSYTEISPSGAGVKVWVWAAKPSWVGSQADGVLGAKKVEVYDGGRGRYFTVTGRHFPGTPLTVESRQAELEELLRVMWPASGPCPAPPPAKPPASSPAVAPSPFIESAAASRCRMYLAKMPPAISGQGGHKATF
jgi:hypothetical protein